MAKKLKEGTLDAKYLKDPAFKAKLEKMSKIDTSKIDEFTHTFQKKRLKNGSIGKRNAIPDRVPISSKEKERLRNKKIKEKTKTLATEKAKKTAEAAKKMKIGMSKGQHNTKSEIKKRISDGKHVSNNSMKLLTSK
jgi:hypothetical protein